MRLQSLLEAEVSTATIKLFDGDITICADADLHPRYNVPTQYHVGIYLTGKATLHKDALRHEFELDKRYTRLEVQKLVRGLLKHFKKAGSIEKSIELVNAIIDIDGFEDLADLIMREGGT